MNDTISRAVVLRLLDENSVVFRGEIEKMPGVDAIPVEWIMKWSNKRYQETQRDVSIVDVLAAWQKEQEAQDG